MLIFASLLVFLVLLPPYGTNAQNSSSIDISAMYQILSTFLKHFKNPNASNMPLPIPDPFKKPDTDYNIFKTVNVTVSGISKLKIENFTSDLVNMKINLDVQIPQLKESGMICFPPFGYCPTAFEISFKNSYWLCETELTQTNNGQLEVSTIQLDLKQHDDFQVSIQNGGWSSDLISSMGKNLFRGLKSLIFQIINTNFKTEVNELLRKSRQLIMPNSLTPIDVFIIEIRKLVREYDCDPLLIPNFSYIKNMFIVDVTKISINGISSFYRSGTLKLLFKHQTLHFTADMSSEELKGNCEWMVDLTGLYAISGTASLSIEFMRAFVSINQPLDLTQAMQIVDLDVKLGNIQFIMNGAGIFDYISEFSVNFIGNLLRTQIINVMKAEIQFQIQQILRKIDIEQVILANLPKIRNADLHKYVIEKK